MTVEVPGSVPRAASAVARGGGRDGQPRAQAEVIQMLELRVAELERERDAARGFGPRNVLTVLGLIVLVGALLVVGYLAWQAITLVLIAVLFALALNPAVEFFVARGLGRGAAAAIVFVLALAVVGLLGLLLIPPLVDQVTSFVNDVPRLISQANRGHGPLGSLERRFHILEHIPGVKGHGDVSGVASSGIGVILGVLGTGASMVIVAFLTFFMLLEGPVWIRRILDLLPERTRPRWERVGYGLYVTVGGFVSGNLVASVLAGVTATVALLATGIPFAIPLGLLVAFLDLLPIFGMIVALVVLAAVALSQGLVAGIVVVGVVFIYHQFEVYLLRPLIYGRTIELSPLSVLVSVVIGTELAGVIGALAAIPVAGAVNVMLCELAGARVDAQRRQIVSPSA